MTACEGTCAYAGVPCDCGPRTRGSAPTRPCGTLAAYKRHQRHGEPACAACKQARADWERQQRRGRNA